MTVTRNCFVRRMSGGERTGAEAAAERGDNNNNNDKLYDLRDDHLIFIGIYYGIIWLRRARWNCRVVADLRAPFTFCDNNVVLSIIVIIILLL